MIHSTSNGCSHTRNALQSSCLVNPLIYINTTDHSTVTLALRFYQTRLDVQIELLMGAVPVGAAAGVGALYFAQKRYLQGIVITGVKG